MKKIKFPQKKMKMKIKEVIMNTMMLMNKKKNKMMSKRNQNPITEFKMMNK